VTTGVQLRLDADWDSFCRLEDEIAGVESTGIHARWRCGRMLLGYEKGGGRGGSELAQAIARLGELASAAELYRRRQFAELYPTEEEVSQACETFGSWYEIVTRGLGRRGQRETPPLPASEYRCITIDPPWPMEKIERDVRPAQGVGALDYPTLEVEEIGELVGEVLARQNGCHVYLWTTHRFMPVALELFETWGVTYQCLLTWIKNGGPTPFSWQYNTEHVLFGRRGSLDLERNGLKLSFQAPAIGHSTKPAVFYERVREASPGPRLAMFERGVREGFEVWGDEVAA
jgi:N6-adenosine-specific RNA methylase IME4